MHNWEGMVNEESLVVLYLLGQLIVSTSYIAFTLSLLVLFAYNSGKQFGPRSGTTKCQA